MHVPQYPAGALAICRLKRSGLGFAQGKSMLWAKPMLDANGGIHALNAEIAEDAASTKLVNRIGLKKSPRLIALEQPLGGARAGDLVAPMPLVAPAPRHLPHFFAPEILLGVLPPLLLALAAAALAGDTPRCFAALLSLLKTQYLPEAALARAKGWRLASLAPGADRARLPAARHLAAPRSAEPPTGAATR